MKDYCPHCFCDHCGPINREKMIKAAEINAIREMRVGQREVNEKAFRERREDAADRMACFVWMMTSWAKHERTLNAIQEVVGGAVGLKRNAVNFKRQLFVRSIRNRTEQLYDRIDLPFVQRLREARALEFMDNCTWANIPDRRQPQMPPEDYVLTDADREDLLSWGEFLFLSEVETLRDEEIRGILATETHLSKIEVRPSYAAQGWEPPDGFLFVLPVQYNPLRKKGRR